MLRARGPSLMLGVINILDINYPYLMLTQL